MEKFIKREIEFKVEKWLSRREIIAIRGTRQCGKTTLLKTLIGNLKENGIDETKIHYVSFEDDFEKEKFEKNPKDYISFYSNRDEKHFFY